MFSCLCICLIIDCQCQSSVLWWTTDANGVQGNWVCAPGLWILTSLTEYFSLELITIGVGINVFKNEPILWGFEQGSNEKRRVSAVVCPVLFHGFRRRENTFSIQEGFAVWSHRTGLNNNFEIFKRWLFGGAWRMNLRMWERAEIFVNHRARIYNGPSLSLSRPLLCLHSTRLTCSSCLSMLCQSKHTGILDRKRCIFLRHFSC